MRAGDPDFDGGLGIARPRDLPDLRRFSHDAMNTVFEVYAVHPDGAIRGAGGAGGLRSRDGLERELSRFRPNSDISRINQLAAGESTRVGEPAMECLLIARHLFELTGGAFDISIGSGLPSLELDADGRSRPLHDGRRPGRSRRHRQGLRSRSGGGAARGVGARTGAGPRGLQLGPRARAAGGPRRLAADSERPGAPSRVLARLDARQMAFSASGVRKGDHIVDPRSGEPVRGRAAAWVALPRPAASRPRWSGPRLAPGRRRGRRLDDRIHDVERRRDRGPVRAKSGPRGLDPAGRRRPPERWSLLHFGGASRRG